MRKVLIGCGIALALGVTLTIASIWMVASWARSKLPDMSRVRQAQADLQQRFGPRDTYTPDAAASSPERIEIFLALRDSLVGRGAEITGRIQELAELGDKKSDRSFVERVVDVTNAARGGVGVASVAMEYNLQRSQRMLQAGMGEGEYAWLFCLGYFAWLGWNPVETDAAQPGRRLGAESTQEVWDRMRDDFVSQLGNLERVLGAKTPRTPEEDALVALLRQEIANASPAHFPLAGKVPPRWGALLQPYRARFEANRPRSSSELILDRVRVEDKSPGFHFKIDERDSTGLHSRVRVPG